MTLAYCVLASSTFTSLAWIFAIISGLFLILVALLTIKGYAIPDGKTLVWILIFIVSIWYLCNF